MSRRAALEVAASALVLEERRRRALDASLRGVVLGDVFCTLHGLAERVAAESERAPHALLETPVLTRLVARAAASVPTLAPRVRDRPGLAGALAATLRDLRDAGIVPAQLPDELPTLRALYARVEEELARLAGRGLTDRIGLFRIAAEAARAFAARRRLARIDVHGAYELVGAQGDLIEALAESVPTRLLQPEGAHPYTRGVRERWPWSFPVEPLPLREDAGGVPTLHVASAPEPRAELDIIARAILARLEAGTPPGGILVVARSLAVYGPWVETTFERYGLPFRLVVERPLLSRPGARALLCLARSLLRDLEPEPTLLLLASPALHPGRVGVDPQGVAELARRLALRGPVVAGLRDWQAVVGTARSLLQHDSVPEQAHTGLRRVLRDLGQARERLAEARGWRASVHVFAALAREWLHDAPSGGENDQATGLEAALDALAGLTSLDAIDDGTPGPSAARLLEALEEALGKASVSAVHADADGICIAEVAQARAVSTRWLFVLGATHGAWPRELREDPFLPDPIRVALRRETGRPLPVRSEAFEEDRYLLHLLVAQAQEGAVFTWHTQDGTGREQTRSPFLREIPALREAPSLASTEATRFLSPLEAICTLALDAGAARAPAEVVPVARELWPAQAAPLEDALAWVSATESFEAHDLRYDGDVGPDALPLPDSLPPTRLEALARCPLRAFLRHSLRVPDPERPDPEEADAGEAGRLVHAALGRLYDALWSDGLLRGGQSAGRVLDEARGRLRGSIEAAGGELAGRLLRRHPQLWEALAARLERALAGFLETELPRLVGNAAQDLRTEETLRGRIPLAEVTLAAHGRIDRIVATHSGAIRVSDYKTGRHPERDVSRARRTSGLALQLPLYALLAAETWPERRIDAEVLPVPLRPERLRDARAASPRPLGADLQTLREEIAVPVRVLLELHREGRFPFRRDGGCALCPYTLACRSGHPPSEARVRAAPAYAAYFELHGRGK